MSGALAGLVVIEIAERPAGENTGRLLAELGAEVIKIEAPGGAPTRRMGPFKNGESVVFAYLNAGKQSVALDLATPEGRATLDQFLAGTHALIDDHDEGWNEARGLSPAEVAAAHPHLVHCAITPFGQGAPPEWQIARPVNVINAGGWAYHSPSETPPDKPPLKGAGRFLPDYESAIDAALAVLASLHRQRETGEGQFIDLSEVQVQLNRVDCVLGRMLAGDIEPSRARTAYDMAGPGAAFPCRDGHVYLLMTTRAHWQGLGALMGDPGWAKDFREDWLEFDCTPANVARFRAGFSEWIAQQDKLPVTEAAQKAGVAMVPVNTAADLPAHEQFAHRGFFQASEHPAFGKVAYPTASYRMSATPVRVRGPAPALNAHHPRIPAEAWISGGPGACRPEDPASEGTQAHGHAGPLAGVRVLALTKVWAGPYAGKLLAHLGAEVIKLESRTNLDEMRAYGGVDVDHAPYFLSINQEVLSAQVNMKTDEGLDLVRQLIAKSDIVIDNLRPGAMERSHLGYADLQAIKPDIIQCSIKMWGSEGPLGWQTGYAPCFAALSGLTALVGHEGETPRGMNIRYGDSSSGACAALACLAALHHRERTGEGQFIDLSAVESMTSLIGDSLFAYGVTGEVPRADGNFHPEMAPHGAYPCRDGEWISLAIADDAQWRAFWEAVPASSPEARLAFSTAESRLASRSKVDAYISEMTRTCDAAELAETLRHAGVPAFKSMSSIDLCSDDLLWARQAFHLVTDHRYGSRPVIAPSWRIQPDGPRFERGAPLLGEHNDLVYRDILGLPPERIDDLIARRIID